MISMIYQNIYDLYDIPIMFPVRSKWFQDLNLKILWTLFSERLYDIMAAKQLLKLGYEWVPGISLAMRPANERCRYNVTTSLIG